MPPRAQRLYPRMRERPPEFRVNQAWPLWSALSAAVIPTARSGTQSVQDFSPYQRHGQTYGNMAIRLSFNRNTGRWFYEFDGVDDYTIRPYVYATYGTKVMLCAMAYASIGTVNARVCGLSSNTVGLTDMWIRRHADTTTRIVAGVRYGPNNDYYNLVSVSEFSVYVPFHAAIQYNARTLGLLYNGHLEASTTLSGDMSNRALPLFIGQFEGMYFWPGGIADVLILNAWTPDTPYQLADPSNVDLRIGGIPLILPPRRRLWPVAPVAEAVFLKRRNLGLRAGTREAIL